MPSYWHGPRGTPITSLPLRGPRSWVLRRSAVVSNRPSDYPVQLSSMWLPIRKGTAHYPTSTLAFLADREEASGHAVHWYFWVHPRGCLCYPDARCAYVVLHMTADVVVNCALRELARESDTFCIHACGNGTATWVWLYW